MDHHQPIRSLRRLTQKIDWPRTPIVGLTVSDNVAVCQFCPGPPDCRKRFLVYLAVPRSCSRRIEGNLFDRRISEEDQQTIIGRPTGFNSLVCESPKPLREIDWQTKIARLFGFESTMRPRGDLC